METIKTQKLVRNRNDMDFFLNQFLFSFSEAINGINMFINVFWLFV